MKDKIRDPIREQGGAKGVRDPSQAHGLGTKKTPSEKPTGKKPKDPSC